MRAILFFFIYSVLLCCSSFNKSSINFETYDTIKIMEHLNVKSACFDSINNYYLKFGIVIPNYYLVKDSLLIDINKDGSRDNLLILAPKTLEYLYDCNLDSTPSRLLVEVINIKGKSKIRNIYPNLISNIGGVSSKYYGIKEMNEGFQINHCSGSKYTWNYIVEYSTKYRDSIYLRKIIKECGINLNKKSIILDFNKYTIKYFNINDTIKDNCNCDSLWHNLENSNIK
jgi:hypothetical protein